MKLDPRRRFRDRLLVGMVAVALLPLAGFAILAALELDSVSRTTAAQAQGAILQHEQDAQQSNEQGRAGLLEGRIVGISNELTNLSAGLNRALAAPAPAAAALNLVPYRGDVYTGSVSDPMSVVASAAPTPAELRLISGATTAAVQTSMQTMRHDWPEIESVWIASTSGVGLTVSPGFDVKLALDEGLLDPVNPMLRAGTDVFAAGQRRIDTAASQAWVNATSGGRHPGDPYWTDTYSLMSSSGTGVSAWIPLHDGSGAVGVDISAVSLVSNALAEPNAAPLLPAAYPLLLSSDGKVVYADAAAAKDFPRSGGGGLDGARLTLTKDARFDAGLQSALGSGLPAVLQTSLAGTSKDVFAAPVYGPDWVLAAPVPVSDLEPDLSGLTYGIAAGVHTLFPGVVLPALVLLLGLAFVVATVLSRRLVGRVGTLTHAAEGLAAGRTDVPVPPQGFDEVGVLATALERMRREINGSRDAILAAAAELEGRVDQRTTELRARNEELVALNELAGSLTRSLDTHVILNGAIDAVRAVHPLRAARGYVLEGETLVPVASWARRDADIAVTAAVVDAVAARSLARRRPVRQEAGGGVVLGLPLVTGQGPVGVLVVDAVARPARDTGRLLQAIADQVALALRTARLSATGREHAVLEERTRLAREIHDTLAQQLTAIVLQLEAAETLIERGSDRAESSVSIAHELARSALQEARRSVWNLRPAPLAATGVVGAIEREVRAVEERSGISARFTSRAVPRHPSLQPAAEVALLRIVQEALANVVRHSGATHVDVTLRAMGEELMLTVRDDGVGFEPAGEPSRQDCFGLEGMRERVGLAGGTLVVVSAPGKGTEVTARVPLIEAADVEHSA